MKRKEKQLEQHLYHEVDDDNIIDFLKETAPIIGEIVQTFNGLEQFLNNFICELFSERSDELGLIAIHGMSYNAKVELFIRLLSSLNEFELFATSNKNAVTNKKVFMDLKSNLRESGRKRNIVVHADYENTEKDGYSYSRLKFNKKGFTQEYIQLSVKSLKDVLGFIEETVNLLDLYWEIKDEDLR